MTPERWRQIEEIFQTVIERAPGERKSALTQYCGGDDELRREVESLLDHEVPGSFIHEPIRGAAQSLTGESGDELIGLRLGAYQVARLIGRGGMGVVYEAVRDDRQFEQKVAIKIVKRGMDTDFVRDRFTRERRILARLEHPNIARLIDGGETEDRLPYFVMEFVEGHAISEYCEANQLSINERLKLFRQVCAAVQFAHQNLVVHRDIKPSNILIGKDGAPKLLDFGIAKLLSPDTSEAETRTITEMRLMTPDYASPEQVRGKDITTASDTYSLGVVLYELLTGVRPHQFKTRSPFEIERAICDTETEKPSAAVSRSTGAPAKLRKQLAGDLDNIVLMAMRKEPERRYQSVEQFSEDIRRRLEGLPVIARNDSAAYRTGKFIQRHKLGVVATALVILSLVGGIAVANYQARRAERRFQQVRKLANTFLFDFHDKIQNLPGSTEARELVAKTALEYLDSLALEAEGDSLLQLELAQAYQKVGDVQGDIRRASLGQTKAARQSYEKALSILQKLTAREPDNVLALRTLTRSYLNVGDFQVKDGNIAGGIETFQQALKIAESVYARNTVQEDDIRLLLQVDELMGDALLQNRDISGALQRYNRNQQLCERLVREFPGERAQNCLALSLVRVGDALAERGDLNATMEKYKQALVIRETLCKDYPTNSTYRRELMVTYNWLGNYAGNPKVINLGDQAAAVDYYQKTIAIAEELAAADPKNTGARYSLAIDYGLMGDALSETDPRPGAEMYRQALKVLRALLESAPDEFRYLRRQEILLRGFATPLRKMGDMQGALQQLRQSLEITQALAARRPANEELQADLREVLLALGETLLAAGDHAGALEHYQRARAIAEPAANAHPADLYLRWRLADAYSGLGRFHATLAAHPRTPSAQRGARWQEARDWLNKSLAVWDGWGAHAVSSVFNTTRRDQAARALANYETQIAKLSNQSHR
ncbi:MAG: protein kinase [Blastocatellales bacterium]